MHHYFAYGTTQRGYPHHAEHAALLGEPIGRFQTVETYGIVVPREAACSNPGCRLVHRMAVLVQGPWDLHAEGDVFAVGEEALAALDRLELAGPYVRERIEVRGPRVLTAFAYPAAEPERWLALVEAGRADALAVYPRALAGEVGPKPCCEREPGHTGPHDVLSPF